MALRPALAAFRRLMRAREVAFRGDTEMLTQSRLAVREEFLRHKVRWHRRAEHASLPSGGNPDRSPCPPARTPLRSLLWWAGRDRVVGAE